MLYRYAEPLDTLATRQNVNCQTAVYATLLAIRTITR